MATFSERMYELSLDALAEQERQVAEIRSRGSTLVAAGAVIASLLTRPAFHDAHPDGAYETAAAVSGLAGCAGLLVCVVLLLRPHELGFSVKAGATYQALWDQHMLEQPMVDIALAQAFEARRDGNDRVVRRLVLLLVLALTALVVEIAGFAAAAALAS